MMACNNNNDAVVDIAETNVIESNCRKDNEDKDNAARKCQVFFKNAIDRYEDRRSDLDCRQKMLNAKIAVMERSIPMLMALSVQKADDGGKKCNSAGGVEQMRKLMKDILPPTPDPAEELLADLTVRVEQLNRETAELHDKIINADIQLEESCIELQSLELANRELEEQIHQLQSKLEKKPSLGSINSDDRICLAKIRELGEIKAHKRRNIQELEDKETLLRCLIEKILGPRPIKPKRLCDVLKNDSKHHMYRSKNRKKKDRQKIDKSKQRTQVHKQFCGNDGCDALKRMINNNSMVCGCYDKHQSPNRKELHAVNDSEKTCSCHQRNEKSCAVGESCECGKYLLQGSQTELNNTQEDPWCSFL